MNILITGAAGLYGTHLVEELVDRKDVDRIFCLDKFSRNFLEKNPLGKFEKEKKVVIIKDDYANLDHEKIDEWNLHTIIHLGAYVSIDESMIKPREYLKNNEVGTFEMLLNVLKSKSQPDFIYASSAEVYGNPKYVPMDEKHPLNPRSFYASAKLATEKHCLSLFEWYGYPVVIIRNFNTFGENQNIDAYSAAIPIFIVNCLNNKDLLITGDGTQTRDFMYVKDAVKAYSMMIGNVKRLKGNEFNTGTGKQTKIIDLANKIIAMSNSSSKIKYTEKRQGDLFALEADATKIKESLGWKPTFTIDEGLKRTIEWYSKNIK